MTVDHDTNVIGAAVLLVADRLRDAVDTEGGQGAQAPALTALHGWADGRPIDALARGLGVSHSRAVRVVDALVDAGLATRSVDPTDRRRAAVRLTRRGTTAAERILRARAAVLDQVLATLPAEQRSALARASEAILLDAIEDRDAARLACRICDVTACGHHDGRCPSTRAADRSGER